MLNRISTCIFANGADLGGILRLETVRTFHGGAVAAGFTL
jgi:hypothetical protein